MRPRYGRFALALAGASAASFAVVGATSRVVVRKWSGI